MSFQEFLNLVNYRKKTVILITVVILIVASLITFLQPLKYSAHSRILIINYDTNTYTLTQSSEYVANILTQAAYSDYFYQSLKNSYTDNGIDWSYFHGDDQKQLNIWENTIEIKPSVDNEFIQVTIYHPNKDQAKKIAWAVNDTLVNKNQLYHGLGDRIKLKVIDNSLTSNFPAKPNIPLNLGLGLILGLVLGLIYVYIFPEKSFFGQRFYNKIHKQDQQLELVDQNYENNLSAGYQLDEPIIPEPLIEENTVAQNQPIIEKDNTADNSATEHRFYEPYEENK